MDRTAHQGCLILVIDDLHELNCPEAPTQLPRLLTNLPGDLLAVLATRRAAVQRARELRLLAAGLTG